MSSEIGVGDWVRAGWNTPGGKHKEVIGEVIEAKERKTGIFLLIKYERTSGTRTSFSWGVHEVWRPAAQCKKLKPQSKSEGAIFAEALLESARDKQSEAEVL